MAYPIELASRMEKSMRAGSSPDAITKCVMKRESIDEAVGAGSQPGLLSHRDKRIRVPV